MKFSKLFFSFLAALALSTAANAAILTSSTGSGTNLVTDYSAPSTVSSDLDLENFATTTLNFVIEQDDLLGPLSMNAIIRNLSGASLERFTFSLSGMDSDWMLETAGLQAGDGFTIKATVSEPSSASLMLSALALIGAIAVRRRDQG